MLTDPVDKPIFHKETFARTAHFWTAHAGTRSSEGFRAKIGLSTGSVNMS